MLNAVLKMSTSTLSPSWWVGDKSWGPHCSWWDRTQLRLPNAARQLFKSSWHLRGIHGTMRYKMIVLCNQAPAPLGSYLFLSYINPFSTLTPSTLAVLPSWNALLSNPAQLPFPIQLSAQMLSSRHSPRPLLFSEGTLPHPLLTSHIVSTVASPLSSFHGMRPDRGWAEIWGLVGLQ